ncbi:uncharacterized protein LOC117190560 [Drosophila miranda]|uniref:uncharacterized protein LOC117190560 n=1 Tax=Drosophila miranda TaxID=7229 RepID=UPI00143F8742|nr:uncharacterized protein LOC117190560 [Drosophila miranda]
MGDRFNDYARHRDATPDLRGSLNTDEEDSLNEDTSRHGTTTPNEDPNADEPMEIDDYAETDASNPGGTVATRAAGSDPIRQLVVRTKVQDPPPRTRRTSLRNSRRGRKGRV